MIVVSGNATVSGILIDCGGPGDAGFIGGAAVNRGKIEVSGTDRPNLFRTERWGMDRYRFTLTPGRYDVEIGFAETYEGITRAGQRTFSVACNGGGAGAWAWSNVDVFAETGGRGRALVRRFQNVLVADDGVLDIDFNRGSNEPFCNYILIAMAGSILEPYVPPAPEPRQDAKVEPLPPASDVPPEAAKRGMGKLIFREDFSDAGRFGYDGRLRDGQTFCQMGPNNIFKAVQSPASSYVFDGDGLLLRDLKDTNYQGHITTYDPWNRRGFLLPQGGGWYVDGLFRMESGWTGWPGGFAFWSMDARHLYSMFGLSVDEPSFVEPDFYEIGSGDEWQCVHHWDRAGGGKRASEPIRNIGKMRFNQQEWFRVGWLIDRDLKTCHWTVNDAIVTSSSRDWLSRFATFRGPIMIGSGPNLPFHVREVRVFSV